MIYLVICVCRPALKLLDESGDILYTELERIVSFYSLQFILRAASFRNLIELFMYMKHAPALREGCVLQNVSIYLN
jgi:hypothetical protein